MLVSIAHDKIEQKSIQYGGRIVELRAKCKNIILALFVRILLENALANLLKESKKRLV